MHTLTDVLTVHLLISQH